MVLKYWTIWGCVAFVALFEKAINNIGYLKIYVCICMF